TTVAPDLETAANTTRYGGIAMPEPSAAGAAGPELNYTEQMLDDVPDEILVDRVILSAARQPRNAIRAVAVKFPGALRVFSSGSVAHGTVIFTVEDADAGVVLDRRSYPDLGPDGDDVGPREVVSEMASFVRKRLMPDFPGIECEIQGKR